MLLSTVIAIVFTELYLSVAFAFYGNKHAECQSFQSNLAGLITKREM